jgi:hypothetical protein
MPVIRCFSSFLKPKKTKKGVKKCLACVILVLSYLVCVVLCCRVVSCRVVSCPVLSCSSCLVLSCRVLLVLSCLVLSYLVLSYIVLSCLVLSCLVLSCLVLSCLVLSCYVLSFCLALPCLVLSCLVLSCLVLSLTVSSSSCLAVSNLINVGRLGKAVWRSEKTVKRKCESSKSNMLHRKLVPLRFISLVFHFVVTIVCLQNREGEHINSWDWEAFSC